MIALNNKYDNPTKKDFDQEIALLFQKGTEHVGHCLGVPGHDIPYGAHFWDGAKEGTMFNGIHQGTVYRFALKVIEAREAWIEENDAEQIIRQAPYQCQTAQAVDRFNGMVTAAGFVYNDNASNLGLHMIGDMAKQVGEEDTAGEVHHMVEVDDDYKTDKDKQSVIHNNDDNDGNAHQDDTTEQDVSSDGQDQDMKDAEPEGYGAFLAQMAMDDLKTAEEDMMEWE